MRIVSPSTKIMWQSRTSLILLSCILFFLPAVLGAGTNPRRLSDDQSGHLGCFVGAELAVTPDGLIMAARLSHAVLHLTIHPNGVEPAPQPHQHERQEHVVQLAVPLHLNGLEPALHPHGREVHFVLHLAAHPNGVEPAPYQNERLEHVVQLAVQVYLNGVEHPPHPQGRQDHLLQLAVVHQIKGVEPALHPHNERQEHVVLLAVEGIRTPSAEGAGDVAVVALYPTLPAAPENTSMHKIEVYDVDLPVPHHACHGTHLSSTVLVVVDGAGVGAERSTPELITAAAQIHETSLSSYSDRESQIHKFRMGGRARFICSPLSASGALHATSSEPEAAAAGKSNLHVMTTAPSELSSGSLFDQIQSGIAVAGRPIALLMIMIARFVTVVDRASERKIRGGGRGRASSAAVLAILLLAATAFAKPATAARPLSGGGSHDEVAADAPGKPPMNDAAAGHSSCTTDPNTQQPVRCIIHH